MITNAAMRATVIRRSFIEPTEREEPYPDPFLGIQGGYGSAEAVHADVEERSHEEETRNEKKCAPIPPRREGEDCVLHCDGGMVPEEAPEKSAQRGQRIGDEPVGDHAVGTRPSGKTFGVERRPPFDDVGEQTTGKSGRRAEGVPARERADEYTRHDLMADPSHMEYYLKVLFGWADLRRCASLYTSIGCRSFDAFALLQSHPQLLLPTPAKVIS